MNKYLLSFLFLLFCSLNILQAKTKIMPLGDSITWDGRVDDTRLDSERSAYRNHLWYKLQDGGYDVDFVGSRNNGGAVRPSYDGNNQGHNGWTSSKIANYVYSFLNNNTPDIILLHIGTNDVLQGYSTAEAVAGTERILNEIDRFEKDKGVNIKVIIARIIKLGRSPGSTWIPDFNNKLAAMIQNRNDESISVVNMENALSYGDLIDTIHPTPTGYQKMAGVWFKALEGSIQEDYAWLIPVNTMLLFN